GRRRHTRFSRDWSSDVCSSDLLAEHQVHRVLGLAEQLQQGCRHFRYALLPWHVEIHAGFAWAAKDGTQQFHVLSPVEDNPLARASISSPISSRRHPVNSSGKR